MVETTLLPLAPVPPQSVHKLIPDDEWRACSDAWIRSVEARLRLNDREFELSASKDEAAYLFLTSYFSGGLPRSHGPTSKAASLLQRLCFLLSRRILLAGSHGPSQLVNVDFLGSLCYFYTTTLPLRNLMLEVWERDSEVLVTSTHKVKADIIRELTSKDGPYTKIERRLRPLTLLSSNLCEVGRVLMAGDDYIDAIFEAFNRSKDEHLQKALVAHIYVGLISLMKVNPPATSALLDQLYGLKSSANVESKGPRTQPTLLSALLCSTNFIKRLENVLVGDQQQKRGDSLVSSLKTYRSECQALHKSYQRPRKVDKGKGRDISAGIEEDVHVHRMSLITQVQDLFPDLGSGYIVQLLDFYNDDLEATISNLIEGTLPEHLKSLDQGAQLSEQQDMVDLAPRPTPPRSESPVPGIERKNVFDNDEFDRLEISPSKLHIGRANAGLTADDLLANKSGSTNKAAILAALAAFDSDDDERDDTYDFADVGGTVDTYPTATDGDAAESREGGGMATELKLYDLYKSNPGAFARDQNTRRSQHRISLRKETGMTDEAIEGWALMLSRDPKRVTRLERNVALSGLRAHQQPELQPTAYRRPANEDGSGEESGGHGGGRGQSRGRGRGGRGGGRGASRGGASTAPESAIERRRKDENKGSRANHNRRNQRAKKMARGGL
ncbi:hypothetical protein H112_07279 [Trichophyton rubrum D6]|uniref:CUE domain-containing protein n=4 Tax=Trichophyton TaxID=5550 RepID=A0A178EZ77_TRIRU|nr:uncharacterized protein TERG_02603 [Trichophyton rubrum CBS 118892]EZF11754.1 hypothetical protein H100_07305 [Trichophyton rubrum MR850]EZF38471.1 hypothetical protein H102_07266 [Trichophyton rubrum CBS 100081]EZF49166.1 hypothetical protein H103_07288 [Trichophyton rubrum CBS 288.86]EZF59811.1 hypothetical protein H104_07241 [Trichophyton rubrum CBS 289.86]EZF70494.1 hypothetical protein H105_07304 [Trichophyton soudanense CBS 452.61]EZF81099.1 hypothetical protein H110_07287 [Trichophy